MWQTLLSVSLSLSLCLFHCLCLSVQWYSVVKVLHVWSPGHRLLRPQPGCVTTALLALRSLCSGQVVVKAHPPGGLAAVVLAEYLAIFHTVIASKHRQYGVFSHHVGFCTIDLNSACSCRQWRSCEPPYKASISNVKLVSVSWSTWWRGYQGTHRSFKVAFLCFWTAEGICYNTNNLWKVLDLASTIFNNRKTHFVILLWTFFGEKMGRASHFIVNIVNNLNALTGTTSTIKTDTHRAPRHTYRSVFLSSTQLEIIRHSLLITFFFITNHIKNVVPPN